MLPKMFTKQDREQYFQEVLQKGRAIHHKIQELFQVLQDTEYREPIGEVLKNETTHGSFTVLLYGVLQGVFEEQSQDYYFIRHLLDSIHPKDVSEKRHFVREPLLGLAKIHDFETDAEYSVQCIDISPEGVGIETDRAIPLGKTYSLEIKLYKHSMPMERIGRLIWLKEIIPGSFIGGIKFENI